jgi:hypothetical protein
MRRMLALVAVLTLGVAASAAAAETPEQMVSTSLTAARSARSVHVVATGLQSGQPLSFDLRLVAGRGGGGTLRMGKLRFDMVRVGPNAYFKGGSAFWTQFGGATLAQLLQGKWIRASATTGDLASFTPLTDIKQLFNAILSSHGALKAGGRKTIGGMPAVGVVDISKRGGGTLWIAATGTPYPLEITQTGGNGVIRFEDWNKPVSLTAPKHALDFDKLKKK